MFNNIYQCKKVFVTGHTGFKGSWLSLWLTKLGAEVCGYSLAPKTNPSMFEELKIEQKISKSIIADILDEARLEKEIKDFEPDIVFHLAAQPIVRLSYLDPVLTYKTNVIGTLNVLEAARKCESVKVFVNITTDKCYENKEINIGYQEDDSMGGHDMYSSSKGCVEIMSSSYRRSFLQDKNSMSLATARAGNVIGGGDWGIDRLIPDLIVAINNGKNIELRSPSAIRPWQYILEPLSGYLLLGQRLYEECEYYAQAFNFGPEEENILNVFEITQKFIEIYGEGEFIINKKDNLHEANLLMLNINKSKRILNWLPTYDINKTIEETVKWYKHFYKKDVDIYEFTIKQIENFEKNIKW